jgi:hypothetical protein
VFRESKTRQVTDVGFESTPLMKSTDAFIDASLQHVRMNIVLVSDIIYVLWCASIKTPSIRTIWPKPTLFYFGPAYFSFG